MRISFFALRLSITLQLAVIFAATVGRSQPIITQQPTNQVVFNGGMAVFSVSVSGTGPFTYRWELNGMNLATNIITTVAGRGGGGSGGDGGAATNAGLSSPFGVAVDADGNLFIADTVNNRIRKVDTNGIITTLAGKTGLGGYAGDGGAATNATLNQPTSVAVDTFGNVFISDYVNMRVREVSTNGIINTVAGKSASGFFGDGGAATNASLNSPFGVALDTSSNLFIGDQSNYRIRKVSASGTITTIAGKSLSGFAGDGGAATNARLNMPSGVAVDLSGNLFIADQYNHRIRKVGTNGIITTVAGNGIGMYWGDGAAATNASLQFPQAVAVDAFGNLFIADSLNNRIRKVDTQGIITTVAGGGTNYPGEGAAATCALLWQPIGVSVDATGNLFIADTGNNRICKVSPTPQGPVLILTNVTAANSGNYQVVVTGSGGSVTSSVAALAVTYAPAITAQPSNVFVTNGNSASFAVAASGTPPLSFQWRCNGTNLTDGTGMSGSLTTNLFLSGVTTNNTYDVVITNAWGSVISRTASLIIFSLPVVAVGPANQSVAVGSTASFAVSVSGTGPFSYQWQCNGTNLPTTNIITTVAGNGSAAYSGDGGPATNAGVNYPGDVALDGSGNLFIADMGSNVIRKVSADGIITTVAGNGTQSYSGDGGQATNASLNLPAGVTLDFFGNLLIADMGNHRIRKVDPTGVIITVAGNGTNSYSGDGGAATNAGLYYPEGVAFDPFGNLFIADRNNSRIREVSPNGIITTVAGIGSAGYSGDGGAATKAQLFYPTGLAVDANGNLLIADMGNQRIRKVSINGIITTVAGNNYVGGYAGDGGPATDARLYCPWKVVADAYGNQFIADNSNSRVRKVDLNGIITTVAGNGASSFSGDGGAATNATLNYLTGVAVDAGGNLFIADHDNNRIRRVDNPQGPVLSLNNLAVGDAGNYQVVVTSPYGSITSSVAKLTVFLPPQHLTAQISGAGLTLQLTGTPNYPYILQSTTNLTPPVIWQSILTNTADASGNWSFVVTNIADLRENYYRAAAQ